MKNQLFKLILIVIFLVTRIGSVQSQTNKKSTPSKIGISGNLTLGSYIYNSNREKQFREPFGYSMNINLTANLYGIKIPIQANFNEQGSLFKHSFNQFGISPSYKWAKLHLGYKNYNWSEFFMSSANIKGLGIELTPGGYRLQAVKGNLEEPTFSSPYNYSTPRFNRSIMAARVGVEEKHGNEIHFMAMKGTDDLNSLPELADSSKLSIPAHRNVAGAVTANVSFHKDILFGTFDGALSAYTDNIRIPDISYDHFPDYDQFEGIIDLNASLHAALAYKGGLHFKKKAFKLSTIYRKVQPEFRTFGVNYLLTDMESITINPSLSVFKGKMNVTGSYGKQFNNLDERLINKTNRNIGSVNVDLNPSPNFGISMQYSNYSLYQQVIKDSLSTDSILIDQINHNYSISPRYSIYGKDKMHNFFLNVNFQELDDKNESTASFSENQLLSMNLNYTVSLLQSQTNITASFNYLTYKTSLLSNNQKGLSLGINKKVFNKKLAIGFRTNYSNISNNENQTSVLSINGNLNYKFHKRMSLLFTLHGYEQFTSIKPISETRLQLKFKVKL